MCRIGDYRKKECAIQWFNPRDEPLDILGDKTELVIRNATFEDNMGLYTCQICCFDQCQKLTSFVYPVRIYRKKSHILLNKIFFFRLQKIRKYIKLL